MSNSNIKIVKCIYPEEFRKLRLCRYMKVDFSCDWETWRIENYNQNVTKCAWMKVIGESEDEK